MAVLQRQRKFILNDLIGNNNKEWTVVLNDDGTFTVLWGRVGAAPQTKTKTGTLDDVDKLVREKVRKGYKEVILHTVVANPSSPAQTTTAPLLPAKVLSIIQDLIDEAGEAISTYLNASVDNLSTDQIDQGRIALKQVAAQYELYKADYTLWNNLVRAANEFYSVIPTKLPHNLRNPDVLKSTIVGFCSDFDEQEQRLNQLEAALASITIQNAGQNITTNLLGSTALTHIVDSKDVDYKRIYDFFNRSGLRVKDIFRVDMPSERAAFTANTFGAHNIVQLTHGSRMANFRHILFDKGPGSGLRIPSHYTNGWMFGPGIYFADEAAKSHNYVSANRYRQYKVMILADVAIGDPYIAKASNSNLREAPKPYHSTLGGKGYNISGSYGGGLLRNEYIVYKQEQQTIKFLVTYS